MLFVFDRCTNSAFLIEKKILYHLSCELLVKTAFIKPSLRAGAGAITSPSTSFFSTRRSYLKHVHNTLKNKVILFCLSLLDIATFLVSTHCLMKTQFLKKSQQLRYKASFK